MNTNPAHSPGFNQLVRVVADLINDMRDLTGIALSFMMAWKIHRGQQHQHFSTPQQPENINL